MMMPEPQIEMPEWARNALRAAEDAGALQRATGSVEGLRGSPAWPLLLEAAVVSTFLPRDLAAQPTGSHRAEAEGRLLEYAEATHTVDGPAWQLRREARADVLRLAWGTSDLTAALDGTKARFVDAVSVALRATLNRVEAVPEKMDLPSLEALRAAGAALGGFEQLRPAVPVAELDRLIRRRRLIEQFERICGGDFRRDVVGRDEELEALNAYVGMIDATTALHRLGRAASAVRRTIAGRKPLAIWGTGGVGKTTLLSRFMLEHIDSAARSYPLAYLDFDRPSLSPRDHFGLFAEICEQFMAQFEGLDAALRELRDEALMRQSGSLAQGTSPEFPPKMIEAFCLRIDKFLAPLESRFESARPVLIVLDTFEVVQYDSSQVVHLERFVNAFLKQDWGRLRLIVSGRKHVKNLGTATEELELPGLTITGADELIRRLADGTSKPISIETARTLAGELAVKRGILSYARVHPLRIRMVGQIFAGSPMSNGEDIAASLIADLRSGSPVASMIEGILVRRIVGHVRDARVRALADPGLVVRRITPEVIRLVMARGTPEPASTNPDPGDSIDFPPWEIGQEGAKEIWTAFSREVSLVEREGQALRHRQDVRAEMLPLIRAKTPRRFAHLHRVAYDYFRERAHQSNALAAEAIYHGLWSGAPLEEIDRIWSGKVSLDARIDPEEFEPGSLPAIYLKSRNDEKLGANDVRQLPRRVAADWAGRFGERFLHAEQPWQDFELVRAAAGSQLQDAPPGGELEAIAARLLYRAGAWRDCRDLIWTVADSWRMQTGSASEEARASTIRLAVHISAKAGQRPPTMDQIAGSVDLMDPIARVEVHANLILATRYAAGEVEGKQARASLQSAIRSVPTESWSRTRLRLAILASDKPDPRLIARWVSLTEDVSWFSEENQQRHEGLASALRVVLGVRGKGLIRNVKGLWEQRRGVISKEVQGSRYMAMAVCHLMVFDHTDWLAPFQNALRRGILGPSSDRAASALKRAGFKDFDSAQVVMRATLDGRAFALAERFRETDLEEPPSLLPGWQGRRAEDGMSYPNSLGSLSHALLHWHQFLLRTVA